MDKRLGTFLHLWGFFQFTQINPISPRLAHTNNTGRVYPEFFQVSLQSTSNDLNLQGKSKKVQVFGSSSYWELEENSRK